MTELLSGVETPSDAELISRVRGGDVSAYGQLFSRHVDAARRLGRQLARGHDVDDLVSDAFAKTLQVLQSGGGPDVAFRAYLLTSVRRLHVDKIRAAKKVHPTDDMTVYDDGQPFDDTAVASFENGAAAKAFSSLPERWQLVLWHLEVEGQKPADIAPMLGMSPNSVSALAYRAREGLRQAFLTMHLADCPTEQCRWVNEHLGAYVRKGLSRRDTTKVETHLEDCRRCTAMYLELTEVNSNLAGIIAPLLLGAAAAGYVSSAGTAGLTGVSAIFGRIRDAVGGNGGGAGATSSAGGGTAGGAATAGGTSVGGAATAGGAAAASSAAATGGAVAAGSIVTAGGMITAGGVIAAGVAAVTTAALVLGNGPREVVTEADQQVGVVQTPPAAGSDRPEEGEPGAAGEGGGGGGPASDTTVIDPTEEGADSSARGEDTKPSESDDAAAQPGDKTADGKTERSGTDTAPGTGGSDDPKKDPDDGSADGPDGDPDGDPGDNPDGGPGPADPPLPIDPPDLPKVEVPLPPVDPLPPVKTPAPDPQDKPGDSGGQTNDPGTGAGGGTGTDTEGGTGNTGGTGDDTGAAGPGRSDGNPGGGNDNIAPPAGGIGGGNGHGQDVDPQPLPSRPGENTGEATQSGEETSGGTQQGGTAGGNTGGAQEDAAPGPGNADSGNTDGQAGQDPMEPVPVVTTKLTISEVAILEGVVVLEVAGDPVIPSAVTVTMTSDPAGVAFGQGGTCEVRGRTTAVCRPAPDFFGAGLSSQRVTADSTARLRAAIPLQVPDGPRPTELSFTVTSEDELVSGEARKTIDLHSDDTTRDDSGDDSGEESREGEEPSDGDDPTEGGDSVDGEDPADSGHSVEGGDPEKPVFGFVGEPAVEQVGSGNERHRYRVRVELEGVADGDEVTLRLMDSQTRFCGDTDCSHSRGGSDGGASSRERVIVVSVGEDVHRFAYEFEAWLPGGAAVSLCATRGAETSSNCAP